MLFGFDETSAEVLKGWNLPLLYQLQRLGLALENASCGRLISRIEASNNNLPFDFSNHVVLT